ncbi:hypothetical protein L3i22_037050 [Actinoplanes sp. L3-i22]|nr:hypothetical protein L3i22_037050 [Actinoplanes sp. L3-i22]
MTARSIAGGRKDRLVVPARVAPHRVALLMPGRNQSLTGDHVFPVPSQVEQSRVRPHPGHQRAEALASFMPDTYPMINATTTARIPAAIMIRHLRRRSSVAPGGALIHTNSG